MRPSPVLAAILAAVLTLAAVLYCARPNPPDSSDRIGNAIDVEDSTGERVGREALDSSRALDSTLAARDAWRDTVLREASRIGDSIASARARGPGRPPARPRDPGESALIRAYRDSIEVLDSVIAYQVRIDSFQAQEIRTRNAVIGNLEGDLATITADRERLRLALDTLLVVKDRLADLGRAAVAEARARQRSDRCVFGIPCPVFGPGGGVLVTPSGKAYGGLVLAGIIPLRLRRERPDTITAALDSLLRMSERDTVPR
jgi:hypothetical protein